MYKEIKQLNPWNATQESHSSNSSERKSWCFLSIWLSSLMKPWVKAIFLRYWNMHYSCFKKGFRGSKGNDFTNGILPVVWKIFEKIISKQLTIIIKYHCGFRKNFSAQIVFQQCWKSRNHLWIKERYWVTCWPFKSLCLFISWIDFCKINCFWF